MEYLTNAFYGGGGKNAPLSNFYIKSHKNTKFDMLVVVHQHFFEILVLGC